MTTDKPRWFSTGGQASVTLHLQSPIHTNDKTVCPDCKGATTPANEADGTLAYTGCECCDFKGTVRVTGYASLDIIDGRAVVTLGEDSLSIPVQTFDFWVSQRAQLLGYHD